MGDSWETGEISGDTYGKSMGYLGGLGKNMENMMGISVGLGYLLG